VVRDGEENGSPEERDTPDPGRPGPSVLDADSWDAVPGQAPVTVSYEGRHHVRTPPPRFWLAIAVVLVGVGGAVAIPLYLTRSSAPSPGAIPGLTGVHITADGPRETTTTSAAVTPSRTPSPVPTTKPAPVVPRPTTATPSFAPRTIEAESGELGGSAWVRTEPGASGGRVVRNLGDWDWARGPGTLQLTNVVFPFTGRYVMTLSFLHPDGEATRTAQVTVSGVAPVTVTFRGTDTCCQTQAVSLTVPAGTRTITIANPTGHAPTLDKVVLSRG
jgi:hypothetical protein